VDGPPFTVSVAWQTYRRTKDKVLLGAILDPLVRTMNYMPRNPTNGLAHINFPGERCPDGFTDSIKKSGDELFCSLLMGQASRQLGGLLEAGGRKGSHVLTQQSGAFSSSHSGKAHELDQIGGVLRFGVKALGANFRN